MIQQSGSASNHSHRESSEQVNADIKMEPLRNRGFAVYTWHNIGSCLTHSSRELWCVMSPDIWFSCEQSLCGNRSHTSQWNCHVIGQSKLCYVSPLCLNHCNHYLFHGFFFFFFATEMSESGDALMRGAAFPRLRARPGLYSPYCPEIVAGHSWTPCCGPPGDFYWTVTASRRPEKTQRLTSSPAVTMQLLYSIYVADGAIVAA